jgi:hypothetical protein
MDYNLVPYEQVTRMAWDQFCKNSRDAWFVHTSGWIDYAHAMRPSAENKSFAVVRGKQVLAVAPVIVETCEGEKRLTYGGLNTPFPAFFNDLGEADRRSIEKFIFHHLLAGVAPDYAAFYVPPLIDRIIEREAVANPLLDAGFSESSLSTNVLKLGRDELDVFRAFRKGCKSDIKTAQKRGFTVAIIDSDNFDPSRFDQYKAIHRAAAGRQTRPDATWNQQQSWLQVGQSILAITEFEGRPVSAAFVNTYKSRAYYQSAATLPEFEGQVGLGHIAQWMLIMYLNKKSFDWYEIGWNYSAGFSQEYPSRKLLGISRFKAGFGADIFPLFRGEYFRSIDRMKSVYLSRLEAIKAFREEFDRASVSVGAAPLAAN